MNHPPTQNPYESPEPGEPASRALSAAEIEPARNLQRRLKIPACILIALAIVHLVLCLFGLVNGVLLPESEEPMTLQAAIATFGLLNLVTIVASGAAAMFIIYGAWQMIWLKSLRGSRAAAIVACIPCLTPLVCFGLPFGAWLAAVLFHREATAEFQRLAAARKAGTFTMWPEP